MSEEIDIRLKRIYDLPSPDDGWRILITRYWPRGVSKSAVDEYTAKVAPSRELIREFKGGGLSWDGFARRYLEEMQGREAREEIRRLAALASRQRTTLMCVCDDESHCHRSLLRDLILKAARGDASP